MIFWVEEDPDLRVFGPSWKPQKNRIQENSAHGLREDYSEFCIISFCCTFIYFVIRIVLHMNNRSQLLSFTTLQFLSIACYSNPPTTTPHTQERRYNGFTMSVRPYIFFVSYSKAIRCGPRNFIQVLPLSQRVPYCCFFVCLIVQRLVQRFLCS